MLLKFKEKNEKEEKGVSNGKFEIGRYNSLVFKYQKIDYAGFFSQFQ